MASGFSIDNTNATSNQYSGQKINLDFVNADIHSIFRLISHVSKLNIVTGDDVNGKISVRMTDVPWDQALDMIFAKFDLAVDFLKNITRLEIMMKINDINKKIHSLLILLGIAIIAYWVFNAFSNVMMVSGIKSFLYMIGSVIALIIAAYLSRDFHNACENLIPANKTTLSSNAILRFGAIT